MRAYGFAGYAQTEQLVFILGILANHIRFGDLAVLDQPGQAEKLAELAFEIELVALVGHEVHIAFTGVEHVEER